MIFRTLSCLILFCLTALPAQAETVVYVHTDALGSPVLETDDHANIVRQVDYRAYGEEVMDGPKAGPGYTGHYRDVATDLVYMQQRYYDPAGGRFLSVDPVSTDAESGYNFNRYWYANNNPYRFTDPDGREAGVAFRVVNNATNGGPVYAPPRSPDDWLGPAIGVALTGVVAAPIAAEVTLAALANPAGATALLGEIAAGDALGGASATIGTGMVVAAKGAQVLAKTPGGRDLTTHAVERMVNPPAGRLPMTPADVDQVLDGATTVRKMTGHPMGATLTIQNNNMPGGPQVAVDAATGNRVVTVISPKEK